MVPVDVVISYEKISESDNGVTLRVRGLSISQVSSIVYSMRIDRGWALNQDFSYSVHHPFHEYTAETPDRYTDFSFTNSGNATWFILKYL